MKKLFGLFAVLCVLSACSEIELGSHIAKQVPKISGQKENVGYFKVGSPYRIKGRTYKPREKYQYSETGVASWYGPGFHGKMTANGEIFNKHELTAAHRTLQMPSMVRVTNLENGRSIIVRVNDRGPFAHDRVIDLSEKAAEIIGMKNQGTARVRVDVLEK
jgi:rare lipoprotein A